MKNKYPILDDAHRAALQAFADEKGRDWKNELSQIYWPNARIWEQWTGTECSKDNGYRLHFIRNNFGPSWLYDVCDVKPTAKAKAKGTAK